MGKQWPRYLHACWEDNEALETKKNEIERLNWNPKTER